MPASGQTFYIYVCVCVCVIDKLDSWGEKKK